MAVKQLADYVDKVQEKFPILSKSEINKIIQRKDMTKILREKYNTKV